MQGLPLLGLCSTALLFIACGGKVSRAGAGGSAGSGGAHGGSAGSGGATGGSTGSGGATGGSTGSGGAYDGSTGSGGATGGSTGSGGATDAGSDAPATVKCDPTAEIQQPGTTLCWRRCPLSRSPDAGMCSGTLKIVTWCDATGNSASGCTPSTPGTSVCETALGPGYRVPTIAEWEAVLGACKAAGPGLANMVCNPCLSSPTCKTMFPGLPSSYWVADDNHIATPSDGTIVKESTSLSYLVVCVHDGT